MLTLSQGATWNELRREASRAPLLDSDTERACLRRIRERDDPTAWELLLRSHSRLVVAIAGRYVRGGLSFADLVAEGQLGLIEAVRRFDLDRDVRFSTYATWWIRSRVREFALDNRRAIAHPGTRAARRLLGRFSQIERALTQQNGCVPTRADLADAAGTTESDVALVQGVLGAHDVRLWDGDDGGGVQLAADGPDPETVLGEHEEWSLHAGEIDRALEVLDPRERKIICERYLGPHRRRLLDIARDLGLSRERVRQIEKIAESKLRACIACSREPTSS